jgi:hypothetical protein
VGLTIRIDAPDELAAFLLTLWIPVGTGVRADVVKLDDRRYEVQVAPGQDWSEELEVGLLGAVEKWLYDHGIESTTVHTEHGDVVVTRPRGAA